MAVAVGEFILVGGPSVSTLKEGEYDPKPIVFVALTLNYTFVFALKIWSLGGTREYDVDIPFIFESVISTQVPVP